MDIPTATTYLQTTLGMPDLHLHPDFREAVKVALCCLKAFHPEPTHAVICEDPELAKVIAQDVNVLNELASNVDGIWGDDVTAAAKHASRALMALSTSAKDPTHRIRLDALY